MLTCLFFNFVVNTIYQPLAVKLETTHKPPTKHPQISQTTHKSATSPTNQSYHPQTSQIPEKPPTNQPEISCFFPWRHFLWLGINSGPKNRNISHPTKYDPFTHPAREEKWMQFLIFLPDFIFHLLHFTVVYYPYYLYYPCRLQS